MLPESKRLIHLGVNFLVAPSTIALNTEHELNLRKFLSENQIEFTRTERTKQGILFLTDRSESLEVHIKNAGPQVNQLLILAPNPSQPVESFIQQCQAITNGFQKCLAITASTDNWQRCLCSISFSIP